MKPFRADLHIHSTWSDGSMTMAEIMETLAGSGVTHASVTDHDTVAHLPELFAEGNRAGIAVVAGIEISACDPASGRKVHVLGYGLENAAVMGNFCAPTLDARGRATLEKLAILNGLGFALSEEEARAENGNPPILYKQHLMKCLVSRGQADGIYGNTYKKLFKSGGPCAGDIAYPDCRDAVRAIVAAGGFAVLAHPAQGAVFDLVPELRELGLAGIEFYHESHCLEHHREILRLAGIHGLALTGGSDSHGTLGSLHEPGGITAPRSLSETHFMDLFRS